MKIFALPGQQPYLLRSPEDLATPCLLIFRDRVERNLERMRSHLERVVPGSGFRHLCPHLKTIKSSLLARWLVAAGIGSFKVTMREVHVAVAAGAPEVFVAYPLLWYEARALAHLIKQHPEVAFLVQAGAPAHAEILRSVAASEGVQWHWLLDLDVGMHRTGSAPQQALELATALVRDPHFHFAGVHGYDGHIHFKEVHRRREAAELAMATLVDLVTALRHRHIEVPRVIVAGSPTFRFDLEILTRALPEQVHVQVSPGTWVLWDSDYEALAPGDFELAALLLAQVIDVGGASTLTLNLGHKRWAADRGPVQLFSPADLRVLAFSEEHTVVACGGGTRLEVGDYVLIAPRHVCPTVNLFEEFTLINRDGEIEIPAVPVDGRNR